MATIKREFPDECYDEDGLFREVWVFSAKELNFFPLSHRQRYIDAGTWPDDTKVVTEEVYQSFRPSFIPDDKTLGSDKDGMPVLVDYEGSSSDWANLGEMQRDTLLTSAGQQIGILQDKIDLEIAEDTDPEMLLKWKRYRIAVASFPIDKDKATVWPEKPSLVGA